MKKGVIVLIVLLVIIVSVFVYWNRPMGCTEDLKICPDGTGVGRIGLNCEFEDCPEIQSYISCGCGCCGFDEPLENIAEEECLFKSKGDNIQDIIDRDKSLTPDFCAAVGCSYPRKYVYCD